MLHVFTHVLTLSKYFRSLVDLYLIRSFDYSVLKDVWQEAKRRKMERYWPPNGFEIVARICEIRDIRDPHAPEGDKWMERGVRY